MVTHTICEYDKLLIKLFEKKNYEIHVLNIMNLSRKIFKEKYERVTEQSEGQCDYIALESKIKFDVKLPFEPWQIELLTNGKKHEADVMGWLNVLKEESIYEPLEHRCNRNYIKEKKLYQIMKMQIEKDRPDENIIFFIPYPIVYSESTSVFGQFASDYLDALYEALEKEVNLESREIFIIYPASEKNQFAIRTMKKTIVEYVYYEGMEEYFSYETMIG